MTTRTDIKAWLDEGAKQGASYMLVVCDTFDNEHYPVYAKSQTEAHEKISEYREESMQVTMEVYNLLGDIDAQLAAHRTWAIDWASR